MTLDFKFIKTPVKTSDTAVVLVFSDLKLDSAATEIDRKASGLVSDVLKDAKDFKAKLGSVLNISLPKKTGLSRIIILGMGEAGKLTALQAEEAGGKLYKALNQNGTIHASVFIAGKIAGLPISLDTLGAHLAGGARLCSYNFIKYKSKTAENKSAAPKIKRIDIISDIHANTEKTYEPLAKLIDGIYLARDLVNEPPNVLYPESYAQIIKNELKPLGVDVEILDEKKMQKLGMGAILAVGMGSARPPRMVIMHWNGLKGKKAEAEKPFALVGKGVTFDTGGISIKPGAGMEEMKMDMGGSAAVVGTIKALAARKAKVNVIGAVGLAENMPSDRAYRPGDIITSHAGKTIEVLNTDAEGRLVLCDVLSYVQDTYKPHTIIDLATLTGAMMVALGHEYCGTFVNDDKLWAGLEKASAASGEKLWRMPLDEVWKKEMESRQADLQNLGSVGRFAGACTAAGFLEHFIHKGVKWAHMDIAGTAWTKTDKPTVPKFGTGFGVRVLHEWIASTQEK